MKTICRLISVVLISMFVFSLTSCSDHEDIQPEKQKSLIVVKVLKSSVKYGDDNDQLPDWPIILEGTTVGSSNVTLESMPESEVVDETTSDTKGVFYFEIEKPGQYMITANHQNGFSEELMITLN
jgi:hypothetical protein